MILTLPIPNSKLCANKTKGLHWSATYSIRTNAKEMGGVLALQYCNKYGFYENPSQYANWELQIKVFYKNNVHPDDDNLLSGMKPIRDGIFKYLGEKFRMNDKQITFTGLDTSGRDKLNPRIEWELKPRI